MKYEYVCDVYSVPPPGTLYEDDCDPGEYPTTWTKVWVEASNINEAVEKANSGDWAGDASPDFGTTFEDGDREYVDVMEINNKGLILELEEPIRFWGEKPLG